MAQLQRLVSAYLDLAEDMALREIPMSMQDWESRLNRFSAQRTATFAGCRQSLCRNRSSSCLIRIRKIPHDPRPPLRVRLRPHHQATAEFRRTAMKISYFILLPFRPSPPVTRHSGLAAIHHPKFQNPKSATRPSNIQNSKFKICTLPFAIAQRVIS